MSPHPSTPSRAPAPAAVSARYALVAAPRRARGPLSLDEVAVRSGMHTELVSRLVTLSVLEAKRDAQGRLWFDARAPALIARAQRLRHDLGLNYAALGLVLDLLDRIDHLEAALRRGGYPGEEYTPWT
ncbi:MAG TPA: chaperone modulator CbpM [Actinospica sp.]|nr:chaperone modulator CbpM [Actinospica sp.]